MKKNFKMGMIAGILVGVLVTAGIGSAAFFATDGFTNLTREKNRLDLMTINKSIRELETMIDENYLNKKKIIRSQSNTSIRAFSQVWEILF